MHERSIQWPSRSNLCIHGAQLEQVTFGDFQEWSVLTEEDFPNPVAYFLICMVDSTRNCRICNG